MCTSVHWKIYGMMVRIGEMQINNDEHNIILNDVKVREQKSPVGLLLNRNGDSQDNILFNKIDTKYGKT